MEIRRERLKEISKEELIILINQKLNDNHLSETKWINDEKHNNWTIRLVLTNKARILNESLIKIVD